MADMANVSTAAKTRLAERKAAKARRANRLREAEGCIVRTPIPGELDLTWDERKTLSATCPCDSCTWWRSTAEPGVGDDFTPVTVVLPMQDGSTCTVRPKAATPARSIEDLVAEVEAWLLGLGRKVEVHEVTADHVRVAKHYLDAYTGTFDYLLDVKRRGGKLTAGQAKGVLNCYRAELLRRPAANQGPVNGRWGKLRGEWAVKTPAGQNAAGDIVTVDKADGSQTQAAFLSLLGTEGGMDYWAVRQHNADEVDAVAAIAALPDGHFAIASKGTNDLLFLKVGTFNGTRYMKMIVGGKPAQPIAKARWAGIAERIIEAGITESAARYAANIGKCARCNKNLTVKASRERGLGPECLHKAGW